MNNEIKEIIDNPKILMLSYGNYISLNDYVKLKDYITNLQEENNRLNKECDTYMKIATKKQQRINKAIEYIEKYIIGNKLENIKWEFDDCDFSDMPVERIKPLIGILKGEE